MENNKKIKVTIVDDNKQYCDVTKKILEKEEEIELISIILDAEKATSQIIEEKPDVVLLDLMMPVKEGMEILTEVMNSNMEEKPKFIVVSGLNQDVMTQRCLEIGACHFMIKPFDYETLPDRIRMYGYATQTACVSESGKVTYSLNDPRRFHKETLEMRVTNLIHEVGIPAHIRGYRYVREAIMMTVQNKEYIESVTKMLYPELAKKFDTTSSRIERAIRHAIEVAWSRGSVEVQNKIFGYTINSNKGKPTNAEFIAKLSDRISVEDNAAAM